MLMKHCLKRFKLCSLRALCALCGEKIIHHKDTEDTKEITKD